MSIHRSLISPAANEPLEQSLRQKLQRCGESGGGLGRLEPLALRLGLIQNTLKPRFSAPQMIIFAADHGLVVDGIGPQNTVSTAQSVKDLLCTKLPMAVFAKLHGLELSVVDCGVAQSLMRHERLLARKIAHGTRNTRVSAAMSVDQAHAAIRAGMEISDSMAGNAVACAGIGLGSHESAALVISRLSSVEIVNFLKPGAMTKTRELIATLTVLQASQLRHKDVIDPVEVLACFGGFEMAMMVGVMLVAASKRHLILVDGLPACAALMVATKIAPAVTDYCLYCRSHSHRGLDTTLSLLNASALSDVGIDCMDGTGAALTWPLIRSAAALLTEVADGEDPGPSQPAPMSR
jgi:nicotinate-nucleotide--dimethylbenzimidazole phosphoribosyltransferase